MDGLKVRTMKDYQGLHLKCDVLLLADVFEKFRNKSLKYYGVCASHYFTAPALSQNAIIDTIKNDFALISDVDIS